MYDIWTQERNQPRRQRKRSRKVEDSIPNQTDVSLSHNRKSCSQMLPRAIGPGASDADSLECTAPFTAIR